MKIDIRHLRWIFLGLYVAIVIGLFAMAHAELLPLWPYIELLIPQSESMFWPIFVLLVTVASQVLFVFAAGTVNLCRPIRRRRLFAPVVIASLMITVLVVALLLSLNELSLVFGGSGMFVWLFWLVVGVNWLGWSVAFFHRYRDAERYVMARGLVSTLLAGSLVELLVAIPSHIIVTRQPGCFVGLLTACGIISGIVVMLWAFGPGIVLLFLYERRKRELADRIQQTDTPDNQ